MSATVQLNAQLQRIQPHFQTPKQSAAAWARMHVRCRGVTGEGGREEER
jgi:hypothetical protein